MAALKDSLSKSQMEQIIAGMKTKLLNFTDFFMKDDEKANFFVPTRGNRIVDESPAFQKNIFTWLDDLAKGKRLAMASPRSFTKSTTCSLFFPLQVALYKRFTEILVVSNSERLAIEFLRKIRTNIEGNSRITKFIGEQQSDKWTETHLILKNGVSIRGCGVGAQIRGFRPDLIILDDIETDESVKSEDIMKKMKDWLFKAAINALTPDGCIIFIGTIISRSSILYDFIHNPPVGWTSHFLQAYKDGIEKEGNELWAEVWPHDRLQARKSEIGTWAFSSEYLNDPMPEGGNAFNPDGLKYFVDKDLQGIDVGRYITVDPAFSESKTADFGVILECLHDSKDNLYVDRYYHERGNSRMLIDYLKNVYKAKKHEIRGIGVEKNGPQKAFYDQMVEEFHREHLYPPFRELTGFVTTGTGTKSKKKDRIIYTLQPRIEAGKLFIRKDQHELLNEISMYPDVRHDDLCDALAYQFSILEPFVDYSISTSFSFENEPDEAIYDRGTTGYGVMYA